MDERIVSNQTLYWHGPDKFSFLWGHEFVLIHYQKDYEMCRILTDHEPEIEAAISVWLKGVVQDGAFGPPDQEDRN